jgi:hypothetical protein
MTINFILKNNYGLKNPTKKAATVLIRTNVNRLLAQADKNCRIHTIKQVKIKGFFLPNLSPK